MNNNYGNNKIRIALWQSAYDRATDFADMAIALESIVYYTAKVREVEEWLSRWEMGEENTLAGILGFA
jgi:hypothetical protein